MIIACPECDTRFVVPSTVFMKGGRKVRCASCKHSWFQEEVLEKFEEEKTDFSEQLRKAEKAAAQKSEQQSLLSKIKTDFTQGYLVILVFFALIIAGYFGFSALSPHLIMGQGIVFNKIGIDRKGTVLTITGEIMNVMDSDRGVMPIYITQVLENDIHGDTIIVKTDKEILHSGEAMPIEVLMENIGDEVKNIRLSFISEGNKKPIEHKQDLESKEENQPHQSVPENAHGAVHH